MAALPVKPVEPMTPAEDQRVHAPSETWGDSFALKTVTQDFDRAERFRSSNHDPRWTNADQIYLAWCEQKVWEGTRVPRASLGVFVALEQIESLLPRYMATVFGDNPWAECEPEPGTTMEQARLARDFVLGQFDSTNGREHARRCFKSALIYGNGIAEWGWRYDKKKSLEWRPYFVPQTRSIVHPILGPVTLPTGQFERKVQKHEYEEVVNAPYLQYVSLKDFYIDPNCESPNVQDARFAIKRSLVTVDFLESLRKQSGYDIPLRGDLIELAKQKPVTRGDDTKRMSEALRGSSWQPSEDSSADPGSKRLELLTYYTKSRCAWMLNRAVAVYNRPNIYRRIPYENCFYTDVLDRFYGLSVCDLTEHEQRLIMGLLNARIDEVALNIHPTRIRTRGGTLPAYQWRRRPGQVIEVEKPREDVVTEQTSNITQTAMLESQASEVRAQKVTGVTDLLMGTPAVGGNSALRTATGVSTQSNSSANRHIYLVENAEYTFIEPILNAFVWMNTRFLDPAKALQFKGQHASPAFVGAPDSVAPQQVDPLLVMNARVTLKMRAAARQRAKTNLLQGLPLLAQTLMHPGVMEQMSRLGKKFNAEEFNQMVMDALDYPVRTALWIPMTPEEQQALNQPPVEELIRMSMQRERIAGQDANTRLKLDSSERQSEFKELMAAVREIVKAELAAQQKPEQKQIAAANR